MTVTDQIPPDLDRVVAGFVHCLRRGGLPVPIGQSLRFRQALDVLGVGSGIDVYWAGRATLVSRPEEIAMFDAMFLTFFHHNTSGLTIRFDDIVETEALAADEDDGEDGGDGDNGEAPGPRPPVASGGSRRRPAPRGRGGITTAAAQPPPQQPPQHSSRYLQDTPGGGYGGTSSNHHSNITTGSGRNGDPAAEPIWTARGVEWPLPPSLRPSVYARLLRSAGHAGPSGVIPGGASSSSAAAAAGASDGGGGEDGDGHGTTGASGGGEAAPTSGGSGSGSGGYGISSYLKGWTSAPGNSSTAAAGGSSAEEDGAFHGYVYVCVYLL